MSEEGWTGIINREAGLIRCPDHGVQKLVPASELDDCEDCEVCVREIGERPRRGHHCEAVRGLRDRWT